MTAGLAVPAMRRQMHHAALKHRRKRAEMHAERKRRAMRERKRRAATMPDSDSMRMCGRKVRYRTKEDAVSAAARVSLRKKVALRAYRCPICHGWHLTKLRAV